MGPVANLALLVLGEERERKECEVRQELMELMELMGQQERGGLRERGENKDHKVKEKWSVIFVIKAFKI